MRESDENDLGGDGVSVCEKIGNAGRQGCCLSGTCGGQDAHIGRWRLPNNEILFVVEGECSFSEDPPVRGCHSPACGRWLNIQTCTHYNIMADIFIRRIQVWAETEAAAHIVGAPPSLKFERWRVPQASRRFAEPMVIRVEDVDCLDCADDMQTRDLRPVVLNLSDDLTAGGEVTLGSGAQEESLWRRTALSATQHQGFYPLCGASEADDYPSEGRRRGIVNVLYSAGVPVLRASEADDYAWLPEPWYCDFIACPALKYPVTVRGVITPDDEATLTARVRLILDMAAYMGNTAVVLGAMGCGAWRTPPAAVAQVFGRVLPEYDGVFREITVAILTTSRSSIIDQFREAIMRLG